MIGAAIVEEAEKSTENQINSLLSLGIDFVQFSLAISNVEYVKGPITGLVQYSTQNIVIMAVKRM